jgi:hypothetical protein
MGDGAQARVSSTPAVLETEPVAVAGLTPHPQNYRTHNDAQLAHLVASITQYGFYKNVVIAADNTILAGHGAVLAAQQLGIETIPAARLPISPNSPAALKVVAADNELSRFADIDDRALTELLHEISTGDPAGLLGTGYDELALAGLLMVTRPSTEIAGFDAAAEWVGMPEYEPAGDKIHLVISFETTEERDDFVAHHFTGSIYRRYRSGVWSGYWPARTEPLQSVASKWASADGDGAEPAREEPG